MRFRAARALVVVGVLLATGCGSVPGRGSKRLGLSVPSWWCSHLPMRVRVEPLGALAGRESTAAVFVGENLVAHAELHGEAGTAWIPASLVAVGPLEVSAKIGLERATARTVVVSIVWLAMPVILSLLLLGGLAARWLRRKRSLQPNG